MTDRTSDIANALNSACMAIYEDTEKQLSHKMAATALNQPLTQTRLDVVETLAKLSHAQKWTAKEIKGAIKLAAKNSNAPKDDKAAASVKTLRSEMKLFCDPELRSDVPDLIKFCEDAWAEEEMQEEELPKPVKKLFSRKYKLVLGIVRAVKNDDASFGSAYDVIEYCAANDPDEDAEKVAKKLERIADQLDEIFQEFHNDDIHTCLDYLRTLEAKDLLDSRAVYRAAEQANAAPQRPLQPVAPASPRPEAVKSPEAVQPVVDGAFDPLAGTLNDEVDMMLAA